MSCLRRRSPPLLPLPPRQGESHRTRPLSPVPRAGWSRTSRCAPRCPCCRCAQWLLSLPDWLLWTARPYPHLDSSRYSLLREIYHHGQRATAPVLQTSGTALVLLEQQPARQLVLFRVSSLAGATAVMLPRYADLHIRIAA